MSKRFNFDQIKKAYFKTLDQYVPVVARVHGGAHPEFHEVRKIYDAINEKTKESAKSNTTPNLTEEFLLLRKITNNYTPPADVCESYEAVYNMLSEIDSAYNQ